MMLSKIYCDHVKNLAFVASTRLECSKKQIGVYINETNGRLLKQRFRPELNWSETFWRDHVKIGRDQRFR